jgi:hypothetical protein
LGNDICVGRKEIIAFFQELKLINPSLAHERAWLYIVEWKRTKGLRKIIYELPTNGKPMIIKGEIIEWIKRYNKKEKKERP